MSKDPIKITCQNPTCNYFMTESGKRLRRNGHNSAGNQQYHCRHCNAYFAETKNTPLYRSHLDRSQVELLAKSSLEKNSARGVARLTNISRDTILRYYRIIGDHAALLNKIHTCNIPPGECEMDEIWSFIKKKNKMIIFGDSPDYGDCWIYTALKRLSGFLISFSYGKRIEETCKVLLENLFNVMDLPFPENKIFFSTDGNIQYEEIIKELYAETCIAYGQVIKEKKENRVVKITFETVLGNMADHKISTSVVEGYNNKIRQRISCFARKTAAFSKSLQTHIAKLNIFQFLNNFIERKMEKDGLKKMIIRTPAMIEGIADHVWTWREFLTCNVAKYNTC